MSIPHDLTTHRAAWRAAITLSITNACGPNEQAYWRHELRAFDRAFDELLGTPTPAALDAGNTGTDGGEAPRIHGNPAFSIENVAASVDAALGVAVVAAPLELSREEADAMIRAAGGHAKMSEVRELVLEAFRRGVAAARGMPGRHGGQQG